MNSVGKRVELHLHIESAARYSTLWEAAKQMALPLPGSGNLQDFIDACVIKVPKNLNHYLQPYELFTPIFRGNFDLLERIAYEYCEDAAKNGIIYLEIRYNPSLCLGEEMYKQVGFEGLCEVVKRIIQGTIRGELDFGIKVRTILMVYNGLNFGNNYEVLRLCEKYYDLGVVGIDLCTAQPKEGFFEEAPLTEEFLRIFREAAQTSVHRTVHAGEASGPSAIDRAVYKLGAERVGHGYHVVQDDKLYKKCLLDNVHFECCPYSSLLTGAIKEGGPTHPIIKSTDRVLFLPITPEPIFLGRWFAKDKANFSLSSDNPIITGHFLNDDYDLIKTWGLEEYQIAAANINAAKASFLPEDEKKMLIKTIIQSYETQTS